MPSRASAWMTMDASPGASVMRSAPDAIVPSGSRPNASQSVRPSGSTMIRSRSIRSPTPAASASSTSAVATPPSVGSYGVDRGELARDLDLGEHAEPGRPEEVPGLPDGRRRHAARAELGLLLARDDRRALERHALGEHHRV